MSYGYILRRYGIIVTPGQIVQHTVTGRYGTVRPEPHSNQHYVSVCFQGDKHAVPCHPEELDYEVVGTPHVPAKRSAMERASRKAGAA